MIPTLFALSALALSGSSDTTGPHPETTPDVVAGFPHGVRVDGSLDLSAVRSGCCVQYVIQKGDTIASISKRALGAAERYVDIAALNPKLDAARLKPGARIWLPAKDAAAAPLFLYMATWDRPSFREAKLGQAPLKSLRPLAETDAYPHSGDVAWGIFAVDDRHRRGLVALAAQRDRARAIAEITQMVQAKKLAFVLVDSHPGIVAGEDAESVVRVKERVRLVRDREGVFAAQCALEHFDKSGKVVRRKQQKGVKQQVWLLLVSLMGACWVLSRRARTRAAAAPA